MSNFQKIKDRIEVLTKFLGKTVAELEKGDKKDFPKDDDRLLGNATISGWYDKSVTWTSDKLDKFLKYYNIRREWWETGEGQILLTSVDKAADNNEIHAPDADEVMRQIIAGKGAYILINKELILEKYRLVSVEQYEEEKKENDRKYEEALRKHEETKKELEERKAHIHALYQHMDKLLRKIPDSTGQVPALQGQQ